MGSEFRQFRLLAVLSSLFAILAIGLITWQQQASERAERQMALEQVEERARPLAKATADRIADLVRHIDFTLLELRREAGVDAGRFRAIADALLKSFPDGALAQFAAAGPDGTLYFSNLGLPGPISVRDREHFKVHLDGGDRLFVSKPVFGRVSNQWSIQFTRPILRQGRFAGMVVVSIAPEYIGSMLGEFMVGEQDIVALFDAEGTFLSHSRRLKDTLGKTLTPARPFMGPAAPANGVFRVASFTDSAERIVAWERVPGTALVANVGLSVEAALAPTERHLARARRVSWALILLVTAFSIVAAALFYRLARSRSNAAANEARLRGVFDQAAVGVALVRHDNSFLRVNRKYCDFLGYTADELYARTVIDVTHPDDRALHIGPRGRLDAGEAETATLEKRYLRKDGAVVWGRLSAALVRDARGAPDYYVSVLEDVTEQKRAETELRRREEFVRLSQEVAHVGSWDWDIATGDLQWSEEMCRLHGQDPATFRPTLDTALSFYHPEDRDRVAQGIERSLNTGWKEPGEYRVQLPDGTQRTFWVAWHTYHDGQGRPLRMIGANLDITARKEADAALQQLNETLEARVRERTRDLQAAKEAAEAASRAKSEFLSRMSHELRTPMNAVLGFGQLLDMGAGTEDQKRWSKEIVAAGNHLLSLIDDLLDLSRVDAGRLDVHIEAVQVGSALADAVQWVQPILDQRGIRLSMADAAGRHAVLADRTRLRQVLVNLLSNAAKYNRPQGEIRVDAVVQDGARLRIGISDTGPGIAPEVMGRLFQPFERLGAESTNIQGMGIGLSIAQRLMTLMDGAIGVESAVGAGSRFWIMLPLSSSAVASTVDQYRSVTSLRTQRDAKVAVLYIEDDPSNRKLIENILDLEGGYVLDVAATGAEGLAAARARPPRIILLDIRLPDMDGYEVLRRLRAMPETRDISVIAVSANAMPHDIERGAAAGFLRYVTKPIELARLREALDAALKEPFTATA